MAAIPLQPGLGFSELASRFHHLSSKAVVQLPMLDQIVEAVIELVALDRVLVKFVISMLLAFVLAVPNTLLPRGAPRHLYSLICGAFLLQFTFGGSWLHLMITSTIMYGINSLTLSIRAFDDWRHWLSAVFSFSYLTAMHYYRLFTEVHATSIDYLVVQMVLIIKLYTFCYNLKDGLVDGQRYREEAAQLQQQLSTGSGDQRKLQSRLRVINDRLERSLSALPNPLEFYGYVFNYTTVFVGPAFEISTYLAGQRTRNTKLHHTRFKPAFIKLFQGLLFMAANFVISMRYPVSRIYTDAVENVLPFWKMLLIAHVALMAVRFGYYFVWRTAEAASVMAGYGLREHSDGSYDWDGVTNIKIMQVETSTSLSNAIRDWNMHTQSWLERYIFRRAPSKFELNRILTYAASAFWHGLFPGYYLGFATVPFMTIVSRHLYSVMRPIIAPNGFDKSRLSYRLYNVLKFIITHTSLDYGLVAFAMYDLERTFAVWRAWKYYGHILPVAVLLLLPIIHVLFGRKAARTVDSSSKKQQ